jgi:hypothetical protein
LQSGLRAWVQSETAHPVGYLEQLYTFADRDRHAQGERIISISYLGLVRESDAAAGRRAGAAGMIICRGKITVRANRPSWSISTMRSLSGPIGPKRRN